MCHICDLINHNEVEVKNNLLLVLDYFYFECVAIEFYTRH